MKKEEEDLLRVGNNVTVTLITQEDFTGRVVMRVGNDEESNYAPSNESVVIENENGNSVEASFSNIKSVR